MIDHFFFMTFNVLQVRHDDGSSFRLATRVFFQVIHTHRCHVGFRFHHRFRHIFRFRIQRRLLDAYRCIGRRFRFCYSRTRHGILAGDFLNGIFVTFIQGVDKLRQDPFIHRKRERLHQVMDIGLHFLGTLVPLFNGTGQCLAHQVFRITGHQRFDFSQSDIFHIANPFQNTHFTVRQESLLAGQ